MAGLTLNNLDKLYGKTQVLFNVSLIIDCGKEQNIYFQYNTHTFEVLNIYVTKKKFDSLERSHCHPNDLIFQKIGSVGVVAVLPKIEGQEYFLLSTNCMKISTDQKIVPIEFVFYYF